MRKDSTRRRRATRFEWTIEVEDGTSYLMSTVSGFTVTDVMMIDLEDVMMDLSLDVNSAIGSSSSLCAEPVCGRNRCGQGPATRGGRCDAATARAFASK